MVVCRKLLTVADEDPHHTLVMDDVTQKILGHQGHGTAAMTAHSIY